VSAAVSLAEARTVLGDDLVGPDEIGPVFGAVPPPPPIPFARDALAAAQRANEMLILRVATVNAGTALTILHMIERLPRAFDKKLLRQVGYQLKDDWGITLEPLAATDTCAPGWALVRKEILDDTRNLLYDDQEAVLRRYAERLGVPSATVRRRRAVETVYDTVLYSEARGVRLLEKAWDWSSSRSIDGGYLNAGGFTANGIQILSFSRAVRHGGLGVCPTRQPLM
jgi:hypothetical protein